MSTTIEPRGTAQILARQVKDMRSRARVAMKEAVAVAAGELRQLAPGSIGEHLEERISGTGGTVTGIVFPTDQWTKYVDEGTGVAVEHHEIQPTAARRAQNPRAALSLGGGVYRKRVRGQRGQHFIDRAAAAAEVRVEEILDRPAAEVTRELTR